MMGRHFFLNLRGHRMSNDLKGKVAIVTGAARGIGRIIAKHLLEIGMSVALADMNEQLLEQTNESLCAIGPTLPIQADMTKEVDIEQMVAATLGRFERLDALINNAGIGNPKGPDLAEMTTEFWNKIIATNLTGPMLCSKHATPALRQSKGSIVHIASVRGIQSEPNNEAYCASKSGIIGLTHAMASTLGKTGVRVNCISPGWIVTEESTRRKDGTHWEPLPEHHAFQPVGRVGYPQDIANMVEFLISEKAGFITGQNFIVDGGLVKKIFI
jgi:NAD(P)-dependent dehydrogenase (short-subunit alcohol dehydrogenase family)